MCRHANGYFIPNNQPEELSRAELMEATNQVVRQFTEMLALVSTSITDGKITNEEAIELREKWQKIQSVTEAYIRECEKGSYRPRDNKIVAKD